MSGSYWGAPADSVTPTIRSPQTSLSQCSFNPTLIPIHFGFSGQELLQRVRLHGGEKARLDLGRISEHSPLSFTLGTQDGNIPFSGFAGWLYIQAGQLHTSYSSDFFGDALEMQPAIGFFLSAAEDQDTSGRDQRKPTRSTSKGTSMSHCC